MIDAVEMLETLKQDFLGMRYTVEFDKHVTGGIAAGITVTETMNFVDWDDACDWATKCTNSNTVPFEIVEMRSPDGKVENF